MKRILVAEDDPDISFALKADLTTEGYTVEVAWDGQAALEYASSSKFDLIVLDIGLPKKDGYAVCRELRQAHNQTPILILTALGAETAKVLGFELGADDYLVKPFSSLELRARLRALLRRTGGDTSEIYRFGGVEVDFTRAEVRLEGKPVMITAQEFKLLSVFIHRRERILTREQLLDEAWPPNSNPTDRVIDNNIMNLRRKLHDDPPRYLISVRGLGYRFDG